MFKVTVKSKSFEGTRYGVQFRKGEAIVEDKAVVENLKSLGYEVEEIKPEQPKKKAPAKKKATSKAKGE